MIIQYFQYDKESMVISAAPRKKRKYLPAIRKCRVISGRTASAASCYRKVLMHASGRNSLFCDKLNSVISIGSSRVAEMLSPQ